MSRGRILTITVTVPAAGAEFSHVIAAGALFHLLAIKANFTSAVAAANRRVSIVIDDGTNIVRPFVSAQDQVASLTRMYVAGRETDALIAGVPGIAADGVVFLTPGLPLFPLLPGYRVRSITANIQLADQFAAIFLHGYEG